MFKDDQTTMQGGVRCNTSLPGIITGSHLRTWLAVSTLGAMAASLYRTLQHPALRARFIPSSLNALFFRGVLDD